MGLKQDTGCRFCQSSLTRTFVDLGMSPLCQTHLTQEELNHEEAFYPLHIYNFVKNCLLVQLQSYVSG